MAKPNSVAPSPERLSDTAPVVAQLEAVGAGKRQPKAAAARSPAREGQTLVGGFFSPAVHRQLKVLAAEQGKSQQALIGEALNMIFASYGKPEIATLTRLLQAS